VLESSSLVAFVTVSDLDAARRFYGETLELLLIEESGFALVFDANGTTLRVAVSPGVGPAPYTVVGWTVADIEHTAADLAERGVRLERFDGLEVDARGLWTTPSGARVGWFKDPHGNVLSITETTSTRRVVPSWVELLTLMVHGPESEPTVRGLIRSWPGSDQHHGSLGWYATAGSPRPSFAGMRTATDGVTEPGPLRVWRDGARIRIDESDGRPNFIAGDRSCWRFEAGRAEPIRSPASAARYGIRGTELLTRRDADEFLGDDFTRPAGPIEATTFLGRPAWGVELAPPAHKPYPMQLVIDAETGLVLQQRNDGFGSVDEWVEFVVGEAFPEGLFSWNGPSRTDEEAEAGYRAEHEAEMTRRNRWFEANVGHPPLCAQINLDVLVNEFDEVTGAFYATLGHRHLGSLARRPHSNEPWEVAERDAARRWSDERFDWAATGEGLDLESLENFVRQWHRA
jgi:catechol 2,3-dioxygenase-like lactoylglutathione lyase family enzyme